MSRLLKIIGAVGVATGLAAAYTPAASAQPTTDPVTAPCDQDNVDCGDWPEEVPPGSPCTVTVEGVTYEGEINEDGVCVCPVPPSTTVPSSTVPTTVTPTTIEPTTSIPDTTVPDTTTIPDGTTSTTVDETTLPPTTDTAPSVPDDDVLFDSCDDAIAAGAAPLLEGEPGYRSELDGDGDGVACEDDGPSFVAQPAASGSLPSTGSNTGPLVASGGALTLLGAALVAARNRLVRD